MQELIAKLKSGEICPYEYIGGGHYRDNRVPKGKKAETLHGQEVIDYLIAEVLKHLERKE